MNSRIHPLINKTFYLGIIVFFVFGCALANGYSVSYVLLVLASLFLIFKLRKLDSFYSMSRWDWALFLSLAFMVFISYAVSTYYGESGRFYDRPSKILLGLLFVYCLRFIHFEKWLFVLCIQLGAIVFGAFALQDIFMFHLERANGDMLEIHFGNFALVWGLASLITLFYLNDLKPKGLYIVLGVFGFLLGLITSILSGSRGGWIYLPIGLLLVSLICIRPFKRSVFFLLTTSSILIIALFTFYQLNTNFQKRVDLMVNTVFTKATNTSTLDTSILSRLEMWRLSADMIEQRPLTGWGEVGYLDKMKSDYSKGLVSSNVYLHRHPHNEYINEFVKRGIFGLLALIAVYFVSFTYFLKRAVGKQHPSITLPASIGVIFVSGYMVFGLTQAVFSHNEGTMYWILGLGILWALTRHAENSLTRTNSSY